MSTILSKIFLLVACSAALSAFAQIKSDINAANPTYQEQRARKLYERLTGTKVPIDNPAIKEMAKLMSEGNLLGAAEVATKDPNFYNITVKLMSLELSTREETVKTPFNDFAASFIGVTRDQTDARELLTGNFYYRGTVPNVDTNLSLDIIISNYHYTQLEKYKVDFSKNLYRVEGQQLALIDRKLILPNPDPAGVLTSLTFMIAHGFMGTNRRLVEYTFREFMCTPMSEMADTGASDSHIGRDVDRFPAGNHQKFLTSCKGCHTVMDGFRGAFASFDVGRGIQHATTSNHDNGGQYDNIAADKNNVVLKLNKNNTVFPSGHITTDNSFVNNARGPANAARFGWRGNVEKGNGVRAFGEMVANSRRFSQCMAKRVYTTVCRKNFDFVQQRELITKWGDEFEASGYKLKKLFELIATKPECM